jgi:hypothetical protein
MLPSVFGLSVQAADPLFIVDKVETLPQPASGNKGLFEKIPDPKVHGRVNSVFVPSVWLKLRVREKISSNGVYGRVYLYDPAKSLIATLNVPSSGKDGLLPILEPGKPCDFFLRIPKEQLNSKWNAVAVFGDQNEAAAKASSGVAEDYPFPERKLLNRQGFGLIKRVKVIDPVVEQVVQTRNPRQPKITLLMRPPKGISDYSEVKGVLCACVLANSVDDIRGGLQATKPGGIFGGTLAFADAHKLAIVAWGSRWAAKNYVDQTTAEVRREDHDFDEVANAWERGIKELSYKYGLPAHDFLLWGYCGSSHWAHRLALRKPEYFLAVHIHIPNNFDAPRPEANRILWLITQGELDPGFENSKRFFFDAKKLNYPIIYKAIIGMGHSANQTTVAIGFKFFEYALTLQDERDAFDKELRIGTAPKKGGPQLPWPKGFQSPPFYGDMVNQECYPASKVDMIPAAFRVALPTKELADIWNH